MMVMIDGDDYGENGCRERLAAAAAAAYAAAAYDDDVDGDDYSENGCRERQGLTLR